MIVVDASVWVSYLYQADLNHTVSRNWMEQQLRNNVSLVCPTLLLAEISGPITRRTGPQQGKLALDRIRGFRPLFLIDLDEALGLVAANLAIDLQLRGADAVYVALAQQLGLTLITWDKEILNRSAGIIQARTP